MCRHHRNAAFSTRLVLDTRLHGRGMDWCRGTVLAQIVGRGRSRGLMMLRTAIQDPTPTRNTGRRGQKCKGCFQDERSCTTPSCFDAGVRIECWLLPAVMVGDSLSSVMDVWPQKLAVLHRRRVLGDLGRRTGDVEMNAALLAATTARLAFARPGLVKTQSWSWFCWGWSGGCRTCSLSRTAYAAHLYSESYTDEDYWDSWMEEQGMIPK